MVPLRVAQRESHPKRVIVVAIPLQHANGSLAGYSHNSTGCPCHYNSCLQLFSVCSLQFVAMLVEFTVA